MRWVTSEDVPRSGELRVPGGAIFTPSARELAESRAIRIIELHEGQAAPTAPPEKIVALGADHGGFLLKEGLKPLLAGLGLEIRDIGVYDEKPADYPDIAQKLAPRSPPIRFRASARRFVTIAPLPATAASITIPTC
jgi:hypothetical protein